MILRLSRKLCTKLHVGALQTMPLDDNPFADWSAHLFVADRAQYIIVSNTKSLYSTVLFGKGIRNDSQFIERALSSLREFMADEGQAFVYDRCIAPASGTITFASALNRSITGSMNELIRYATVLLVVDELSPPEVGFRLNDFILSAIASRKSAKYGRPREAFKDMINGSTVP